MTFGVLKSGLRYTADLILPPVCVSCSTAVIDHNSLCAKCWCGIDRITPPFCDRLGIPLPGSSGDGPHLSTQALRDPPVFARGRAAAIYSGIMRGMIVRFKFEDKHEPLKFFLNLMVYAGRDLFAETDLLVPVPLHRLRLLQRRFNQSAVLTQGLSRATGLAHAPAFLTRYQRTVPQVGLTQDERKRNVMNAFRLSKAAASRLKGKSVLLVDDVMTTGATLNSCAATLLAGGAARVNVLVLSVVNGVSGDDPDATAPTRG